MGALNCLQLVSFSLILILVQLFSLVLTADPTDISRLRQDLLNGYDKNARPIQSHRNTTLVTVNPWLRGFEFDENRSIFTVHCWTVLRWNDDHLKWEPKNYGNLSLIHFAAHEIWQPDLSVYNNFDQSEIDHFGNTRVIAYSSGAIVWVPPTRFQVGCSEDLRQWPYDVQSCPIVIGSWAHDGNMLDLALPVNMTTLGGSEVVENREWKIVKTDLRKNVGYYGGIPYPDITLSISIQRRSGTHTCAVVVPALAISTAVLISFWLRPGASERLALLLLVLVINALYLNRIYTQILTHGDRIPLVLLFYRDSLIMASLALVWTICLRYVAATKRTSPVPLPGFVEGFLSSLPAKILCLDPRPTAGSISTETDDDGKLVSSGNPNQADWAWLAHLLDRIAFVLYFIVYVCFYAAML